MGAFAVNEAGCTTKDTKRTKEALVSFVILVVRRSSESLGPNALQRKPIFGIFTPDLPLANEPIN